MIDPTYLVAAGGVLGALLRHFVSRAVPSEAFPLGTFTVNVLGSFVLGLTVFQEFGNEAFLLVGTGACGSFTTFSSFSVDVVRLWDDDRLLSVGYAAANLFGSLSAIAVAWFLSRGL
ncbi:fluoride efflux transporter CrcB [Halostella pelagica]|uniref:fluoride efflux transporter CrcB n=1 Tax=Halostella pelagica TaxID=2583824 RepID=UPI0010819474|nr:fluoride efflux transporter CrcB [Halostella pelagica]